MRGIIYKYTFPDGKVYIGQTRRNSEMRKSEHMDNNTGPKNSGFWEAYQKYGTYEYEEIWEIEADDEEALVYALNAMETNFIIRNRAYDPQYGYNKRIAGTVGTKTNAILRRKKVELQKALLEIRLKDYKSACEKIFETKEPLTKEERYLVAEKYKKENLMCIKNYDFDHLNKNVHDERREFDLEQHLSFLRFLIEKDVEAEIQKYMDDNYDNILSATQEERIIVQMDKEGKALHEFKSLNEVCQHLQINSATSVWNVLKGKQKTAYGCYWKYKKDI